MFYRNVKIAYVMMENMEALREALAEAAATASVTVDIKTKPGPFGDCNLVEISAWSENEGSVADFYNSLLVPLSWGATESDITRLSKRYIERVRQWCEGVNAFFREALDRGQLYGYYLPMHVPQD